MFLFVKVEKKYNSEILLKLSHCITSNINFNHMQQIWIQGQTLKNFKVRYFIFSFLLWTSSLPYCMYCFFHKNISVQIYPHTLRMLQIQDVL